MSANRAIDQQRSSIDVDFWWVSSSADKAAALTMVRASVHLALSSAQPEEILATIDAVMLSAA